MEQSQIGNDPAGAESALDVGLDVPLVLYVEKIRWNYLTDETKGKFCIQAYTDTPENLGGYIKFTAAMPNV